jgi:hypothetical protein
MKAETAAMTTNHITQVEFRLLCFAVIAREVCRRPLDHPEMGA